MQFQYMIYIFSKMYNATFSVQNSQCTGGGFMHIIKFFSIICFVLIFLFAVMPLEVIEETFVKSNNKVKGLRCMYHIYRNFHTYQKGKLITAHNELEESLIANI